MKTAIGGEKERNPLGLYSATAGRIASGGLVLKKTVVLGKVRKSLACECHRKPDRSDWFCLEKGSW